MTDSARFSPEHVARIDAVINATLKAGKRSKRHPADVTADRLGAHLERYYDRLHGAERDEISHVIYILRELAGTD